MPLNYNQLPPAAALSRQRLRVRVPSSPPYFPKTYSLALVGLVVIERQSQVTIIDPNTEFSPFNR